jgi:hypothetical protein
MAALRHLQSHVCSRLRLHQAFDIALRFGKLPPPARQLHTMASIRTSDSALAGPLPRMQMKRSKSTATTGQIDHSRGNTKLLEDEKWKHSLLARTMKELLDAISNSREQLQHIEPWFWNLVENDQKRQLLVECAVEGFQKAGIYTLLEDGVFTIDQLVKTAPNAKKAEVPGIYARLYLAKSKSALYVGSSGNVVSRMEGHDRNFPRWGSLHANAYARAIGKHYRVLCDLNDNIYALQDERIRLVIEQLVVILLGTYATLKIKDFIALGHQPYRGRSPKLAPSRHVNMEDLVQKEPEVVEGESEEETLSRISRGRSARTSFKLAKLGLEVCTKCGWQPNTARLDPNTKFGTRVAFGTDISPLNWLSPIDTTMGP